jgi:hypothetical protein
MERMKLSKELLKIINGVTVRCDGWCKNFLENLMIAYLPKKCRVY